MIRFRLLPLAVLFAMAFPTMVIANPAPVKIFIMAGQSNTQGHGEINPATSPGTLSFITTPANDPQNKYQFLKDGTDWVTRDDVSVHYQRSVPLGSGVRQGGLTVGYGAATTNSTVGPELGFGHVLGDLHGEKILLIKTCWGGKSLGVDFLPPSSEDYPTPLAEGDKGFFYKRMLEIVNSVTANIGDHVDGYSGEGFEFSGFAWHQGYNDRVNATLSAAYETNMANFIRDVRTDLNAPDMPFVIATTGMGGGSVYTTVEFAQMRMADATLYPEFTGNVRVIDTRNPYEGLEFWQPVALSPADQGFHWNRNAKTYLHIGQAMGDAMSFMVKPPQPYRLRAAGDSSGITLTWQNGLETPTSVRILRNNVEIATGLPATPTTFLDAAATPGVHEYQVEFTMPGDPVAPLTTTFFGDITALQAFRAPGGVLLIWENAMNYPAIEIRRDDEIIATLAGDETSWFDAAAPASGLVTYTAAPTTGTTTPASAQINLSAAPSGNAVIYEPFEYDTGPLNGKGGSETGLTGTWSATSSEVQIVANSLASGTLPTHGGSISTTGGNSFGGTRQISPAALSASGLLDDGATLWFSVVMGYGTGGNVTNSRLAFALSNSSFSGGNNQYFITDKGDQLGSGLGVTLGRFTRNGVTANGYTVATHFRDASRGTTGGEGNVFGSIISSSTIGADQQRLVVGKISWGAGSDLIELYEPDSNLNLGPVASSLVVDVDQSTFDTLTFTRGNHVTLDEIRFGANLQDVLGVDTASGYWDLNGTTAGSGGIDGNEPTGIWNTDANWNAAFTGTGPVAPWTSGNKAVFSAGSNATGAYTVTIDGTRDIGGLAFEEGTPTLTGGTALRMTADSTLDVKPGITATIHTPLTEDSARSLSKEGSGALILTGTNSYTGSTNLYSGTLHAASTDTLPGYSMANKIVFKGGTLGLPINAGWSTAQVNTLLGSASKFDGAIGIDTIAGDLTQWAAFTNTAASFGDSLGLTKLGPNTLTLNQANTYNGITRVRQGTLALAHDLALQNSALATATAGAITLRGMSAPTIGGLLDNVDLAATLGSGYSSVSSLTLNLAGGKLAVYEGAIADGAPATRLVKTGAGTQVLRGENTYTGQTTLSAGTLILSGDFGTLAGTSGIHLEGGTLILESIDTDFQSTLDRIGDTAPITSHGGSLTYTTFAPNSIRQFNETLGATSLLSGRTSFALTLNKISGGQTLGLTSLTRPGPSNGSTATFAAIGTAPNATRNMIQLIGAAETPAGGILGPWATTGTTPALQTDYARIDNSGYIVPANIAATTEEAWISASGNYTCSNMAVNTLTANRTIHTLRFAGSGNNTPSIALGAFNLELNGLLFTNTGNQNLTISGTGGVIRQPGTAPANLYLTSTTRQIIIPAPIEDNIGALTLVKSGSGLVDLTGGAGSLTYSGDTHVNSGDLRVNSANPNNDASAIHLSSGARMILNYTGTNTVQRLYIDGQRMPNGVYNRNNTLSTALGINTYFGTSGNGTLTVSDTVAPTLISITDDQNGGPVALNSLVTYTVTFSEEMDAATITAADFGNAGTATATIGTVTPISPSIYQVPVTPTSTGTLQLRINAGTDIRDFANTPLNTTSAIADDTIITVNDAIAIPYEEWSGGASFGDDANNDGILNGIAFLLGADGPMDNAQALLPKPGTTNDGLTLTFHIRNAAARGPATVAVQWSADLGVNDPWAANTAAIPETTQTINGIHFQVTPDGDLNHIIATIPHSEAAAGKLFVRISGNEN